jgi:uncharacterized protein (DUF433 family)
MVMENMLTQHIEITPDVCGGRPRIAGHRITVSDVAVMHLKMGYSMEEIATEYDLTLADVYAAMAYYYDHREEIERQLAEEREFVEAFRKENPSLLQERLRNLRGE